MDLVEEELRDFRPVDVEIVRVRPEIVDGSPGLRRECVQALTFEALGTVTLARASSPVRLDLDFAMGTLGARGVLLVGGDAGATLAAKSDALAVHTGTQALSTPRPELGSFELRIEASRRGAANGAPADRAVGVKLSASW